MSRSVHFDCSSGVSSDMLLGALLDLGADADEVVSGLRTLGLREFRLRVDTVERKGVTGRAAAVEIAGPPSREPRAEAAPAHEQDFGHRPERECDYDHDHDHGRDHDHDHDHGRDHDHDHDHHHHHDRHSHVAHRDVAALINGADIDPVAKSYVLAAYAALAEAEAAAHGVTADEVHFHEVGSPRAIYTVCGAAIAASLIGVTDFTCGALRDGSGEIECSHGVIPVPVPAVRELLKRTDLPLVSDPDIGTELVTPSGLALLIGFGCRYANEEEGRDPVGAPVLSAAAVSAPAPELPAAAPDAAPRLRVGYGFGSRDTGLLGAVRATLRP